MDKAGYKSWMRTFVKEAQVREGSMKEVWVIAVVSISITEFITNVYTDKINSLLNAYAFRQLI